MVRTMRSQPGTHSETVSKKQMKMKQSLDSEPDAMLGDEDGHRSREHVTKHTLKGCSMALPIGI